MSRKSAELKGTSIRLSETDLKNIYEYGATKSKNISDATRSLIRKGLRYEAVSDIDSDLSKLIRQTLDAVLKPHINRLANIGVKACLAAGTSKYLLTELLQILEGDGYHIDTKDLYEEARHKAYEDLRAIGNKEEE